MKETLILLIITCCVGSGQSTISTINRYGYSTNSGWIDFRPSATDGVIVGEFFLSGKAYAASFGWIDLGDGSPVNGHTYSNTSAADCGVNLSSDGRLNGSAYSANCGWITFEQAQGQPRIDFLTGKLIGFAYSGNLGWISLDTTVSDLDASTISSPDNDLDGIADAWEMFYFSNLTTATPTTDTEGDGQSDVAEFNSGTDPKDSASRFRLISYAYSPTHLSATVSFTTSSNRLYRIEHDNDLAGAWTNSSLGTFAPDAGPQTFKTISLPGTPARFIRVAAIRPLQP